MSYNEWTVQGHRSSHGTYRRRSEGLALALELVSDYAAQVEQTDDEMDGMAVLTVGLMDLCGVVRPGCTTRPARNPTTLCRRSQADCLRRESSASRWPLATRVTLTGSLTNGSSPGSTR
jgi:hypothetical protein